jgi:glycosyltransferase involved in cell wall biosynthesis
MMSIKICAFVDDPEATITQIRIRTPVELIAKSKGWKFNCISYNDALTEAIENHDLFIMQRAASPTALRLAKLLTLNCKPYIYDIDDLLTNIPDSLPHHSQYKKWKSNIEKIIKLSTTTSVSTEILREKIKKYQKNCIIAPNYPSIASPSKSPLVDIHIPETSTPIIIASSDSIPTECITTSLKNLKSKHGKNITIITVGPVSEALKQHIPDAYRFPILSPSDFIKLTLTLQNAIGIMPLDDSEFSSCKSAIKYFDYSMAGIACVCSNVSPYKDVILNNKTGLLTSNNEIEWEQNINKLIADATLRQILAKSAFTTVNNEFNIHKTTAAWEKIIELTLKTPPTTPSLGSALSFALRKTILTHTLRIKQLNKQRIQKRRARRLKANNHQGTGSHQNRRAKS